MQQQVRIKRKAIWQTILLVLANVFMVAVLYWLEDVFSLKTIKSEMKEKAIKTPISFIIFAAIFAPLFEELSFRYNLKKEKHQLIIFILSTVYFLFAGETKILLGLMLTLNLLIGYFLFVKKVAKVSIWIAGYSIIVFAAMHSINFNAQEIAILNGLEIIFLFLPYILLACNLTFIRLKYGFYYGLFGHVFYNSLLLFLHYFFIY